MRFSRPRGWAKVLSILASAAVLPLGGCIAHAPGSGGGQQVQVTLSANLTLPAKIPVSTSTTPSTLTFTATVAGTSNQGVTWTAVPYTGTTCTGGSIQAESGSTATFTASETITASPCQMAVTATSTADSNASATALVQTDVVVVVSPATDTIGQGENLQYTAQVVGASDSNQQVTWSASDGRFDPENTNLFIAPGLQGASSASVTITASSVFDSQQGTATTTVLPTDPLGKVSSVQPVTPCPADSNGGLSTGTCYSMTVSCDQVSDISAYLKVNVPTTPVGTVLFLTGSGGTELYDNNPTWSYGYLAVENIYKANFSTVQLTFGNPFNTTQTNGWLQGPGGVRRLACRYATVADWIYNNPTLIGLNASATSSAPYCATGSSGGSGALAYAMYEYGLAGYGGKSPEFSMVEHTSGPPMSRLDFGCVCNSTQTGPQAGPCTNSNNGLNPMCFSPSEASIIDAAYQTAGQTTPTLCSDGLSGAVATNANRFLSDSILYNGFENIATPKSTTINVRLGGMDTTQGPPQSETWIVTFGAPPNAECTADADHEIPNFSDGAQNIATDIIAGCIAPAKKAAKTNPTR